ncbi:MAG TPA: FkbM family methyltransferase [Terriglobia bacterium]|nr:FkbM family methyltransferase [Terriglobia bacterium]
MSGGPQAGIIKSISYNNRLRNAAGKLGLSHFLNAAYFAAFGPTGGYLELGVDSLKAKFVCDSPTTFRFLEGMEATEASILEHLLRFARPGDVVYDIGASFGFYSIFLAKKVGAEGKVVAFEPEEQSYNYLLANTGSNQLKNLLPYRLALGNEEKQAFLGGNFGGFSLLQQHNGGQSVRVLSGDSLVQQGRLPPPRVVKIDVEGYELEVIKGLAETLKMDTCQLVCCEVHPNFLPQGTSPQDVESALKNLGFTDIQTHPHGDAYHAIAYKNRAGASRQIPGST